MVKEGWWQRFLQKLRSRWDGNKSSANSQRRQPSTVSIEWKIDLTREPNKNLGLPPEAIPGLSTIKALVRGIRYRTIDELVGHEIKLTSLDKGPEEICSLISKHGIEVSKDAHDLSIGGFMKYGILEYDFDAIKTEVEAEPQRVRFLKEMGLLLDREDVDDEVFPDAGLGFLEDMVDEIKENKLFVKVFLDSRGAYRGSKGIPKEKWMNTNPDKYFPCDFAIRDACITNCSSIWLNKYFYL